MKYIYLVNGSQHGENISRIIQKLRKASGIFGRDYRIKIFHTPEEAHSLTERCRYRECVIAAVGGDGSIHYLLNDLMGSKNILSFVPYGTGNDFNRGCMKSLSSGIHEVDIIRINDRYCINNACFGIDADIANDDRFIHNQFIPKLLRFHAGVVHHFLTFREGRHLIIECNGKTIEGDYTTVIAANSQYYGGGYRVSPDSRIDDGLMEVYLVDKLSRPGMAKVILSMKSAGHLSHPALKMMKTKRMTISSSVPFEANIDGEPLQSDRFELELIPRAVRLEYDKEFIECFKKA